MDLFTIGMARSKTSGGAADYHICSSSEYSSVTGLPIVSNPVPNRLYLVPINEGSGNNHYNEYYYKNGNWELFGNGTKQVEFDSSPKGGSENAVTSGGVHAALSEISGDLNELEMRVNNTISAVGSPLIANTAADMTNIDKVYVYQGEETGYTAGNWYYYNGTAWASGGVYNAAAVNTDKTLTVENSAADAKVVGDSLNNLINVSTTQPSGSDNRLWINPNDNDTIEIPTQQEMVQFETSVESNVNGLSESFAPRFDDLTAYSTGDYVVNGGVLYKFKSDHAAGAWTENDVTAVKVMGEVDNLKDDLSENGKKSVLVTGAYSEAIPENGNVDTYTTIGSYKVANTSIAGTIENLPINRAGRLLVFGLTGGSVQLQVYVATNGNIYHRRYSGTSWYEWNIIAQGFDKNYVDSSINDVKAKHLGLFGSTSTLIPENSNLNVYTTPGNYRVANISVSKTIENMPISRAGRLTVIGATGDMGTVQIFIGLDGGRTFIRTTVENSWTQWSEFAIGFNKEYVDQIKNDIKFEFKDPLIWSVGYINTATGGIAASIAWLRSEYLENIYKVKPVNGYYCRIYAYDADKKYVGQWDGVEFSKPTSVAAGTNFYDEVDFFELSKEYKYRICIRKDSVSKQSIENASNLLVFKYTDDTLSLKNTPADAFAVGKYISSINDDISEITEETLLSEGFKNADYDDNTRALKYHPDEKFLEIGYIYLDAPAGATVNPSAKYTQFNISPDQEPYTIHVDFTRHPYLLIKTAARTIPESDNYNDYLNFYANNGSNKAIIKILPENIPEDGIIDLLDYVSNDGNNYTRLEFYGLYASGSATTGGRVDIRYHIYGVLYEDQIKSGVKWSNKINTTALVETQIDVMSRDAFLYKKQIPEYYFALTENPSNYDADQYLEGKIASIPKGKHFIFITDTHWDPLAHDGRLTNAQNSTALIGYIRKRTGIRKVVFGGDLINRAENKYIANMWEKLYVNEMVSAFGTDFIYCHGNHDMNTGNIDQLSMDLEDAYEQYMIPYEEAYKSCFKYLEGTAVFDTENYLIPTISDAADRREMLFYNRYHFWYDDEIEKVRYISVYSGTKNNGIVKTYTNTYAYGELLLNVPWLYRALSTVPEGYDIVCVAHQVIDPYNFAPYNNSNSCEIPIKLLTARRKKSAFTYTPPDRGVYFGTNPMNFDFTNCPDVGAIIFANGHWHVDQAIKFSINENGELVGEDPSATNIGNGMLAFSTQCDAYGQLGTISGTWPMEKGTITEQCFDIVTYNDTGVYFTRIGAGEDRSFLY